jgi:hypothetical protein
LSTLFGCVLRACTVCWNAHRACARMHALVGDANLLVRIEVQVLALSSDMRHEPLFLGMLEKMWSKSFKELSC